MISDQNPLLSRFFGELEKVFPVFLLSSRRFSRIFLVVCFDFSLLLRLPRTSSSLPSTRRYIGVRKLFNFSLWSQMASFERESERKGLRFTFVKKGSCCCCHFFPRRAHTLSSLYPLIPPPHTLTHSLSVVAQSLFRTQHSTLRKSHKFFQFPKVCRVCPPLTLSLSLYLTVTPAPFALGPTHTKRMTLSFSPAEEWHAKSSIKCVRISNGNELTRV